MLFKDALILSFYLDGDDPEEIAAFEALKMRLDWQLRAAGLGRYDADSFSAQEQCFKIDLAGNDAELMLETIMPLVKAADFLIGPRATLIMRSYQQSGRATIRHVDL